MGSSRSAAYDDEREEESRRQDEIRKKQVSKLRNKPLDMVLGELQDAEQALRNLVEDGRLLMTRGQRDSLDHAHDTIKGLLK